MYERVTLVTYRSQKKLQIVDAALQNTAKQGTFVAERHFIEHGVQERVSKIK